MMMFRKHTNMQSPSCNLPSSLCVPELFQVFNFRNTQSKIFEKNFARILSGVQRRSAFSDYRTDFHEGYSATRYSRSPVLCM
jgi:hypothetical protein